MSARRGAASSLVLAVVLALVSLLVGGGSATASTRTAPLRATFTGLLPGSVDSHAWGLRLSRDAVVTEVTTTALRPGTGVEWDAWLSSRATGERVPVTPDAVGVRVAAGDYDLTVRVRALDDIAPGATYSLDGHLVVADATTGPEVGQRGSRGPLALTGADALPLLLAALAAALVGLLLLVAARRRRRDDETTTPEPADDDPSPVLPTPHHFPRREP
ncbi:LPXTG cell wall anchor domain-containing protein [Cellulomonas sp. JZ18]|uniref:LPXTG cell wall anchor domain-containing protein n=1 Tax=Cellulomonas sp. JZ18 TaxID=2654191 RepID=UPI0012D41312|nr:LPXTG cell wall anchor domain-containing protein [Cellulomonas sp. JZ18]QGQ19689.1 LPXTG cell wall anchor domain-containing protein [Cellulomonas sp. JZ18]